MQLIKLIDRIEYAIQAAYAVLLPIGWGIAVVCYFVYYAGAATAQWWHSSPTEWDKAQSAAPIVDLADLALPYSAMPPTAEPTAKPKAKRTRKAKATTQQ